MLIVYRWDLCRKDRSRTEAVSKGTDCTPRHNGRKNGCLHFLDCLCTTTKKYSYRSVVANSELRVTEDENNTHSRWKHNMRSPLETCEGLLIKFTQFRESMENYWFYDTQARKNNRHIRSSYLICTRFRQKIIPITARDNSYSLHTNRQLSFLTVFTNGET